MTRDEATKLIVRHKLIVTGDSFHKLEALIDFAQAVAAAEREACAALFDDHNIWDEEAAAIIRTRGESINAGGQS